MTLAFHKFEGLGNDFLLVDRLNHPYEQIHAELDMLAERAPALCDRRRGVGGDGLLVVGPGRSPNAHATMWVLNFDGSRPEMCGNGLRCVAHWVAHHRGGLATLHIDTDDGLKPCHVDLRTPYDALVNVDMGPGRDEGLVNPKAARHPTRAVSMGNPHAIAFVDEDPEPLAHQLGPAIEVDPVFPNRTNVEFARIDPEAITLWVWERGVGITEACGTGACATACAAVWSGHASPDQPIHVDLPGGRLVITVPSNSKASVTMKGPSRWVFSGEVPTPRPSRL